MNAYFPIMWWFTFKMDDVDTNKSINRMYRFAWYVMWTMHWTIFSPMAFLWPFTYIGSSVIVDFYDVANWYLGTLAASGLYATVACLFALAALNYTSYNNPAIEITRTSIW